MKLYTSFVYKNKNLSKNFKHNSLNYKAIKKKP